MTAAPSTAGTMARTYRELYTQAPDVLGGEYSHLYNRCFYALLACFLLLGVVHHQVAGHDDRSWMIFQRSKNLRVSKKAAR